MERRNIMAKTRSTIFRDSTKRIENKDLLSLLCEIIDTVRDENPAELTEVA